MSDPAITQFLSFFSNLVDELKSGNYLSFEQRYNFVYRLQGKARDKEEFRRAVFQALEEISDNNNLYICCRDVCTAVAGRDAIPTFGS